MSLIYNYNIIIFSLALPLIITPPQSLQVFVREPFNLTCITSGRPLPVVSWFKDGVPLVNNSRIIVGANTVSISDSIVNDTGIYTCTGTNAAGTTSHSANVIVSDITSNVLHDIILHFKMLF